MKRLSILVAFLVLGGCGSTNAWSAMPLPCSGDRFVKVVEIPAAKQPRDFTVELGYKFPGCFSQGEWIGYVNNEKYIKLDAAKSAAILEMAVLKEFPSAPSRLDYPWETLGVEIIEGSVIIGLLMYGVIGSILEKRKVARILQQHPELRSLAERVRHDPKLH